MGGADTIGQDNADNYNIIAFDQVRAVVCHNVPY